MQYAEVRLYLPTTYLAWNKVDPESVCRYNDGAISFKCVDDDGKTRRNTVYGSYVITYPPDINDNKG